MPKNYFSPKFGRFGVMPIVVSVDTGSNPYTANNSVDVFLPTPSGKFAVLGGAAFCSTIPADPDGTLLVYVTKRRASDNADVVITDGLDLESLTANERGEFVLAKQPGSASNIFLSGDVLKLELVSNSAAIGTQPVGLIVTVELGYLE